MIANKGYGRWHGGGSFADSVKYVRREGEDGHTLAEWSHGVASIESAAVEMSAVAGLTGVVRPVDHRVISWSAGEVPSIEEASAALTEMLRGIGYGHATQYVAAMHDDGRAGMVHLHAIVNRVDPLTQSVTETYNDFEKARAVMREVEQEQGWRELPPDGEAFARAAVRSSASEDRYGARKAWREYIRTDVAPAFRAAYDRADATLESIKEAIGTLEIPVKIATVLQGADAQMVGIRLASVVSGLSASIADVGVRAREFIERFRDGLEADRTQEREARESIGRRAASVRERIAELPTSAGWSGVHRAFEDVGLSYDSWMKTSARIMDIDSRRSVKATSAEGLSRASLEKRFGVYIGTAEGATREAERVLLQARQERAVAETLARMPEPLIASLFDKDATIGLRDLENDLQRRFVSDASRSVVREALMERCVAVAMKREGYEEVRLTTREFVQEGERVRDAAKALLDRRLPGPRIEREYVGRPFAPSGDPVKDRVAHEIADQQRAAYVHAVQPEGQLKVITGVPGAGKTTLIKEIAAAYQEAGYEVRAVSVVTQAVKILREETGVPSRTVAKELARYEHEIGLPTPKTLLIVDEVSTLGAAQGARLLEALLQNGGTAVCLGDDKQCPSVARGNTLSLMRQSYESASQEIPDLEVTARQKIEWMREATHDVRAGRVRAALEAYRDHGSLVETNTRESAKIALVKRWEELQKEGKEVAIAVLTNEDRRDVNALVRSAYRERGGLKGDDVRLNTLDGAVPYAVGELVRARKAIPDPQGERQMGNGASATVERIDGAVLYLRDQDGKAVAWDTRAHPEIEHAYSTTTHREQGRTGWGELQLLNGTVRNQTLTVGMTRHEYLYEGFYAREDFRGGFDDVVKRAERFDVKENAIDGRELGVAREALAQVRDRALEREIERELERLDFSHELVASDLGLG